MRYEYQLERGPKLYLENEGEQTSAGFSSGGSSQQQSQSRGFDTGAWEKMPTLYRQGSDYIVQLHAPRGPKYLSVQGDRVVSLNDEPDLGNAETLQLQEAAPSEHLAPMEPMKPMRPMEPMKPMKPMEPMGSMQPMKPMQPMAPMEMRMGGMHMQMGGGPAPEVRSEKRFCTQCGAPVQPTERFCGKCGHAL